MQQSQRIYLDNNATTVIDPRVINVISHHITQLWGNPSSIHHFGQLARNHLTASRQTIASFLHVKPSEIVFTSGGTESLNMVIKGLFGGSYHGHILSSSSEHSSVFATIKQMESFGCRATFLSAGLLGAVSIDDVRDALQPDTKLIALMAVNNETGVKTDIASIAKLAKERGIAFLVDGVALLGKELFHIPDGVSAMAFSGHKLHAPKGIGFAFIRHLFKLHPLLTGGEQEFSRRGGTENLLGIIGLAESIKLLGEVLPVASEQMRQLRDYLEEGLMSKLSHVVINGQGPRIVNTSNLSFGGIEGESLLTNLDMEGIAVSHGSACSSGALEPSRVLLNMGIAKDTVRSAIRFSLSRFTTKQEIDSCIEIVTRVVSRLRKMTASKFNDE